MELLEGQVMVRGLVMGPGTPYTILTEFNPHIRSARVTGSQPRVWNHGSWAGTEWGSEAVIPIKVLVTGESDDVESWQRAHQDLAAAFRPVGTDGDQELRWVRGGREYLLIGRPRMVEPEMSLIHGGNAFTQLGFVALDPRIYSGTQTIAGPIGLPTFTGGLTFPMSMPFTISGVLDEGTLDLTNTGTADAELLFRIDGPVNNPAVTLQRDDGIRSISVDVNVSSGYYLEIDTAARSVLLNGSISQRGVTSTEGEDWPTLPPGVSTVRFRGSGSGTLTVRYRSVWW